jgi:ATP-dependent Clp protease ATP-binding subunit ClpA
MTLPKPAGYDLVCSRQPDSPTGRWGSQVMFDPLTPAAQRVLVIAGNEAQNSGQRQVGTEHLLLGLLDEEGIAARALGSFGITSAGVRGEVSRYASLTLERFSCRQITITPRLDRVLECSYREALRRSQDLTGPEHLLLGLAAENNGLAVRILCSFGVEPTLLSFAVDEMISTSCGIILKPRERGFAPTSASITDWFPIEPSQSVRRLLMIAAGCADMDQRCEIQVRDLLAGLAHSSNVTLLTELGVDAESLRAAIERLGPGQSNKRGRRSSDISEVQSGIERCLGGVAVAPGGPVRRLLTIAAANADEDRRALLELSDLLLALILDGEASAALEDLGVDARLVWEGVERCRRLGELPAGPTGI